MRHISRAKAQKNSEIMFLWVLFLYKSADTALSRYIPRSRKATRNINNFLYKEVDAYECASAKQSECGGKSIV